VTVLARRTAVIVAALACVAQAGPNEDAKVTAAADAGTALFAANDFAGAAAKFREAYDLSHDASYLFNVAQAYRHAGDCVRAADYYGRFLGEIPHPPNEDKIRVWYASEMQCAKERAASAGPAKPEPGKPEPAKPEPAKPAPLAQPPHDSSGHRGVVIGLAATSVVAFGVGGFFAWDSSYLENQRASFLNGCSSDNRCSSSIVNRYDSRGSRANTIAIVGFAAGGVALAAAATVFVLSGSHASETAPVAVVPLPGGALVARGWAW
jgi:tetratricopeptide (TPR) repeat protein